MVSPARSLCLFLRCTLCTFRLSGPERSFAGFRVRGHRTERSSNRRVGLPCWIQRSREREAVEVWARYAGNCRRLRRVYLAKGRNTSPKTQKNDNDNAIRKIINKNCVYRNAVLLLCMLADCCCCYLLFCHCVSYLSYHTSR